MDIFSVLYWKSFQGKRQFNERELQNCSICGIFMFMNELLILKVLQHTAEILSKNITGPFSIFL